MCVILWLWLEQSCCCRTAESSVGLWNAAQIVQLSARWCECFSGIYLGQNKLDVCKIKVGLSQEWFLLFSIFTQLCLCFHLNFTGLLLGDWGGIIFCGFWGAGPCSLLAACSQPTFLLRSSSNDGSGVAVSLVKVDTWGFSFVAWCLPLWSPSALCISQEHCHRSIQNTNKAACMGARETALPCSCVSFYLRKSNWFAEVSFSTL